SDVHALLEALEARAPLRVERDHLRVEGEVAAVERGDRIRDLGILPRHGKPVPRPELDPAGTADRGHPDPVPLELEHPARPARDPGGGRRQHERELIGREPRRRQRVEASHGHIVPAGSGFDTCPGRALSYRGKEGPWQPVRSGRGRSASGWCRSRSAYTSRPTPSSWASTCCTRNAAPASASSSTVRTASE